jgi:hypothetical protein
MRAGIEVVPGGGAARGRLGPAIAIEIHGTGPGRRWNRRRRVWPVPRMASVSVSSADSSSARGPWGQEYVVAASRVSQLVRSALASVRMAGMGSLITGCSAGEQPARHGRRHPARVRAAAHRVSPRRWCRTQPCAFRLHARTVGSFLHLHQPSLQTEQRFFVDRTRQAFVLLLPHDDLPAKPELPTTSPSPFQARDPRAVVMVSVPAGPRPRGT